MLQGNFTIPAIIGSIDQLKGNDNFKVLQFSVAEDASYKDRKKDEWVDKTVWHKVKAFNKKAESYSEKLKVGDMIWLTGNLRYDKWEVEGSKREKAFIELVNLKVMREKVRHFTTEDIPF